MSGAWIAFWAAVLAPASLYLAKRIIDYVLPPEQHWPWLDRFTVPNKPSEEDTDEN